MRNLIGLLPTFLRWRLYSRLFKDHCKTLPLDSILHRRIRPHGLIMALHEADWIERYAARTGWYYEDVLIAVLEHFLKPGWTFVDVGANVGFATLMAASKITNGKILSFEPNPIAVARLRENVTINRLQNVEVHDIGLGCVDGEAALAITAHHGTSSMRTGIGTQVQIRRGDEFEIPEGVPVFIKIDVEGFELKVLQGLTKILSRPNVVVLAEITDRWLHEAGGAAQEIFDLLADYRAFHPTLSPLGKLCLTPNGLLSKPQYDMLFVKTGSS